MDIVESVKKIDGKSATIIVAVFVSIVAPGLLILMLYKPVLFKELETIKLILLSISLSLPLWTLNAFVLGPPETGRVSLPLFGASQCSGFAYYFSLYISYLAKLNFTWFSVLAIFFNLLFVFCFYRAFKKA